MKFKKPSLIFVRTDGPTSPFNFFKVGGGGGIIKLLINTARMHFAASSFFK